MTEEDIRTLGSMYGVTGVYVGAHYRILSNTGYFWNDPWVFYNRFSYLPEDSIIFGIPEVPYHVSSSSAPIYIVIAAKESPEVEQFSGKWYASYSYKEGVLDKAVSKTLLPGLPGGDKLPPKNGYNAYFVPVGVSDEKYHLTSVHCPYVLLEKSWSDFRTWWINDFNPDGVSKGAILLNPNGKAESVAGKAYDYDTVADHCEAVIGTKPVFYPDAEPLPNPLPEGAPLYPPVSGLDTIPQVKPEIMPDYEPIPTPNPNPDVPDIPDVPDVPDVVAPITGIKDKFPFCVPYDLIDAFKVMTAEPETPRWEVRFPVPGTNETKLMVIDLEPFNGLAKLTRTLLLLLFIVCLAVGTRNMIAH